MTGVPCRDGGESVGERRQIPVAELARLRFPLAVPRGKAYDLFAPPWRRAYTDVAISGPRIFRDDAALAAAYRAEKGGSLGSMDDFVAWARNNRARQPKEELRRLYRDQIISRQRGRPAMV